MPVTYYTGTGVVYEGVHTLAQSASTSFQDPEKFFWAMGDTAAFDSATDIAQWSMTFNASGFAGLTYDRDDCGNLTLAGKTVAIGGTGSTSAHLTSASVSVDSLGLPSISLTYTCFGAKSGTASTVSDTHAPVKGVSLACSETGIKSVSFNFSRNVQLLTELGNATGYAILGDIPTLTGSIDSYSGALTLVAGTFTLGSLSLSGLRVINSGPKANVGDATLTTTYVAWNPEAVTAPSITF